MKSIVFKTVWDEWSEEEITMGFGLVSYETVHSVKERCFVDLQSHKARAAAVRCRDRIRLDADELLEETGTRITNVRVLKVTTETIG